MDNLKDRIYLSTISRAFMRLAEIAGDEEWMKGKWALWSEPLDGDDFALVDEAERLASGSPDDKIQMDIPSDLMVSLLDSIGKGNDNTSRYRLKPHAISFNKDEAFAKENLSATPDYKELWRKGIKGNITNLRHDNQRILAENLLNILFRYGSAIPSNQRMLDVSLYDQTRVAASIATSLYQVRKDGVVDGDKPFLLVGADFSGIQSYIYQIVSRYAAKSLKGRSFYIHLLSDACVGYLLDQLGLYNAGIIYDSGGCFYLLAPNTRQVKESLDAAIAHIEKQLFEAHGTSIFVAIDSVPVSREEVAGKLTADGKCLRDAWQLLFDKRDKKKFSKFSSFMNQDFFSPKPIKNGHRDIFTGEDDTNNSFVSFLDGYASPLNKKQVDMGRALRTCDCIAVSSIEIPQWENKTSIKPANLGRIYYMLNQDDILNASDWIETYQDSLSLRLLNGRNGSGDYTLTKEMGSCETNMEFYGGKHLYGKTLEELCKSEEQDSSYSRMGVLRMDVDNLGSIFQKGIERTKANLSRYAALSRAFDYFFSGYLGSIVDLDKCYVIYSGGDDLFIVGGWQAIIDLAHSISTDFKEYTCNNPAFSISGGISTMKTKYPLISGAELSAAEESKAKNHAVGEYKKNSISFIGTSLNWEYEYPVVVKLKDKLVRLLISKQLPKSFISKIVIHAMNAEVKEHKVTNVKTYWMLSYDLTGLADRCKKEDKEVINMLYNCQREVCQPNGKLDDNEIKTCYHPLELWAYASRWAEMEYRSTVKEEND